jgi:hypothetical protein
MDINGSDWVPLVTQFIIAGAQLIALIIQKTRKKG